MANTANKPVIQSRSAKAGRTVFYRGVKITPMTGKRSALAEAIREGLRSKTEGRLGDPSKA